VINTYGESYERDESQCLHLQRLLGIRLLVRLPETDRNTGL
jgi:hypothetical protein